MTNAIRAIFLDFDGVLHDADIVQIDRLTAETPFPRAIDGRQLFEFAPLLAAVLKPYPHVHIVAHSSWCRYFDLAATRSLLAASGLRIDGVATGRHRQDRIAQYAHDNGIIDWIAIDDEPQHFDERWRDRLIACHPNHGLSDDAALGRVREWLAHPSADQYQRLHELDAALTRTARNEPPLPGEAAAWYPCLDELTNKTRWLRKDLVDAAHELRLALWGVPPRPVPYAKEQKL